MPLIAELSCSGLSQLIAPSAAAFLAKLKHGVSSTNVTSAMAICIYKTQLCTLIVFNVVTILLAPIVAVYVLDGTSPCILCGESEQNLGRILPQVHHHPQVETCHWCAQGAWFDEHLALGTILALHPTYSDCWTNGVSHSKASMLTGPGSV